jgi:hypothetical protein
MRRFGVWFAIALMLTTAIPAVVRACPMCSEAVTETSGADEDDAMREARAYNNSIYLMAGMPYLMLSGFSYWVYRGLRRRSLAEQGTASNPTSPTQLN